MNFLDVRTVIASHIVTDLVCTVVIFLLWVKNRKRYSGIFYLLLDFVFQTVAVLLVSLRARIPDLISIVLSNSLVIAGALSGYIGLTLFVEKKSSQIHNYILLVVFVAIHYYFTFFKPDLMVRTIDLSFGLLIICFQCMWLMLLRVEHDMRRITAGVGIVFGIYCLFTIFRIVVIFIHPFHDNDLFNSSLYETFILMMYQMLLILLTFSLSIMINHRLLMDIKAQEDKFSKAFRSSPYALTLTRLSDGKIIEVNDYFINITGYSYPEVIGKTTIELKLWAREIDRADVVDELMKGNRVIGREFQFLKKSGEILIGLFSSEIIIINNQSFSLSSISDITDRKKDQEAIKELNAQLEQRVIDRTKQLVITNQDLAKEISEHKKTEEVLKTSLDEKEVLLREVHHRVKNNLAAISGMIQIQKRSVDDVVTISALTALDLRLRSMAIIHEKLYRSENFCRINFDDYLNTLIPHIRSTFNVRTEVRFSVASKGVEMVLDNAVPCGLIINELITNAIKYAFPETFLKSEVVEHKISINVECHDSSYILTVADNGVGLPDNIDFSTNKTLGLHLVKMLGEHQLGGSIELYRAGGTSFILKFNSKY
ncbi:MAG: PAS domain S-box protein [Desulfobacterales bacterium]|nr:PAS domain S-box protein [Desulfobacterales bacterium]MBF0397384.1 PAS domain S-box protein [Desulfobacterales bacterium]